MSVEQFGRGTRGPAAGRIKLERHDSGKLVLIDADGHRAPDVEPIRAFPFSNPEHWVSLRDAHAREIFFIEDLAALDPRSRAVLDDALARREFVPLILRINAISTQAEPSEWWVETDRGATRFALNSEDDVRPLSLRRVLIVDTHGMRYLIPDIRTLDAASRHLLEHYV